MLLKEVVLKNFRGYQNEHRIPIDQLTAFIGRNDAGKSTIFDALAVFFDNPLVKIDVSDVCVHAGCSCEVQIGCVFTDLPEKITIDTNSSTSLSEEYLLNQNGYLEIHKIFEYSDGKLKKQKIIAIANHPTSDNVNNLICQKNAELKKIGDSTGIDSSVDRRSNVALRRAIWEKCDDLQLKPSKIQLDKEDSKKIWDQLYKYLPEYALFRADRPSTDEDAEVQDPLKVAVMQAIKEVQPELDKVKEKVREHTIEVAERTIVKLADFDKTLASELTPIFKSDPKWDSLFKLSLTGDYEIPINKRGSGVRRLVLFSFFRAEAERLKEQSCKSNLIYAIEEPETAQHPNYQRKIIESLQAIAETDGCQVMLTTHVPALASLLPVDSIRYISLDDNNVRSIKTGSEDIFEQVASDLGVLPDRYLFRVRVAHFQSPHEVNL